MLLYQVRISSHQKGKVLKIASYLHFKMTVAKNVMALEWYLFVLSCLEFNFLHDCKILDNLTAQNFFYDALCCQTSPISHLTLCYLLVKPRFKQDNITFFWLALFIFLKVLIDSTHIEEYLVKISWHLTAKFYTARSTLKVVIYKFSYTINIAFQTIKKGGVDLLLILLYRVFLSITSYIFFYKTKSCPVTY